jgi:hypothetical protein
LLSFFRRRKKRTDSEAVEEGPRPPIAGQITLVSRTWNVTEQKRAGPRPQLLVLKAADEPAAEIHVRPDPDMEAKTLEDVEPLARNPTYRWFQHAGGRWEVRIVQSDTPPGQRIKFVSWTAGVYEGDYAFRDGLGVRTDEELRALLAALQKA